MFAASAFHVSASSVACTFGSPADACAARPLATTGRNALQLHHVISATSAIMKPLMVIDRYAGENSSASRGGAAISATDFHRSGSLTNMRTRNATAAGTRPNRKT